MGLSDSMALHYPLFHTRSFYFLFRLCSAETTCDTSFASPWISPLKFTTSSYIPLVVSSVSPKKDFEHLQLDSNSSSIIYV